MMTIVGEVARALRNEFCVSIEQHSNAFVKAVHAHYLASRSRMACSEEPTAPPNIVVDNST
eukprot:SAG31_NODE_2126_length_6395_cov_3.289708_4_plen_61_part_00